MKLFTCPSCSHVVYFESTRCIGCGARLGYHPEIGRMVALEPTAAHAAGHPTASTPFRALPPSDEPVSEIHVRLCANTVDHDACNWVVPSADPASYCRSCRLNEVIPPLETSAALWRRLEAAKRRLLYTVFDLELPVPSRAEDPQRGLAFVFREQIPGGEPVMTGYGGGTITINVAEADDAHRERTRAEMGERYRSLLGHFRHESGHYFWQRLIDGSHWLRDFRQHFGDERADYAAALQRHYAEGPRPDWVGSHVSPYATAHPWEDWAETWAHYLHILDTLETARAYGISLRPKPVGGASTDTLAVRSVSLQAFDGMIASWIPLTLALNDINRSMGLHDLYPFALSTTAIQKIAFVHRVVHER